MFTFVAYLMGVTSGAVTGYLCRISEFLVCLVLLNLYISEYRPVVEVICFHSSLAWFYGV